MHVRHAAYSDTFPAECVSIYVALYDAAGTRCAVRGEIGKDRCYKKTHHIKLDL